MTPTLASTEAAGLAGAPADSPTGAGTDPRTAASSRTLVASRAVVLGATSIVVGVLWDISWHRTIGRDTFWTPAHLAIYLGGLLGGLTAAWLILRATFRPGPGDRESSVGIWGFRGPLGAWVCAWGSLAMLTSAPFDNWWHDAYGLDVKILSPPHTVLALGMWAIVIGALLMVLREQNLAALSPGGAIGGGAKTPGVPRAAGAGRHLKMVLYAGGVIVAMVAVFHTEESWPNQQRNRNFYLISCASYPLYLIAVARASGHRWGATLMAAVYMAINLVMLWVLPLFPGQPRLGPIYNPVDHFVPLAFPLLLVAPAVVLDLLRRGFGPRGMVGWRGWAYCVVGAIAFVAVFGVVQWHFSEFVIGPGGQNAFFGADRHWDYTERLGPSRFRFWSETSPRWNVPATFRTFVYATGLALVSLRLGLWLGNGMGKVRR